jgi:hypothetical protein
MIKIILSPRVICSIGWDEAAPWLWVVGEKQLRGGQAASAQCWIAPFGSKSPFRFQEQPQIVTVLRITKPECVLGLCHGSALILGVEFQYALKWKNKTFGNECANAGMQGTSRRSEANALDGRAAIVSHESK